MKYFVDWAHKTEKLKFCDAEGGFIKKPKFEAGDEIYGENIPWKYCKQFLEKGIKIFRVHGNKIADHRKTRGSPKIDTEEGDELDVQFIREYYGLHPEDFKKYEGEPVLKQLYASFKEIQKTRVATQNRLWSVKKDEEASNEFIYDDLADTEKKIKKKMTKELEKYPIWEWLQKIKGINTATASGLVAYIGDIGRFNMISSLWNYSGLDVVNGKAPRKTKGQASNHHQKLKSLLLGIIGDSFIKQRTPIYRNIYDNTKQKELDKTYPVGYLKEKYNGYAKIDTHLSLGHAHNRATRKMIKVFVQHYWVLDRQLHGLDTRPMYVHETLKHEHYILPDNIPLSLIPFKPWPT